MRRRWKSKGSIKKWKNTLEKRKSKREGNFASYRIHSNFVQYNAITAVSDACPFVHTMVYTAAGPSVHPAIYILARGPFALCQAILIPIYHFFLRRFFFSISLFFLGASFFFKPFDSNWFLSGPLIRMPLSSFLYSSSSSSSLSTSLSYSFFPSFFHSIIRRYADANLFSRAVSFSPTHFFISGYLEGREFLLLERKAHDDVRKGSYRNIGLDQTFARFVAHEKRMFAIRQRGESIVRIAYYSDSLILRNYTLIMREETINIQLIFHRQ